MKKDKCAWCGHYYEDHKHTQETHCLVANCKCEEFSPNL